MSDACHAQFAAGDVPTALHACVVVVNYGSHELVESNLRALDTRLDDLDIVVVDNHSSDEELQALTDAGARHGWSVVANPTNAGFGAGANLGAREAVRRGADVLVFLNPDARADQATLAGLVSVVRADPHLLVCPRIVSSSGRSYFRGSQLDLRNGRTSSGWSGGADPDRQDWLTGACLVMGSAVFELLGGFSDDYFLYWEDVDLSRRAVELGLRLAVLDDYTVIHDEGGTQHRADDRALSAHYYFYNTRNRLLFAARRLDPATQARWLWLTPRESLMIWMRGGRRQVLRHPDGLVAAGAGSLVGACLVARSLAAGVAGAARRSFTQAPYGPTLRRGARA